MLAQQLLQRQLSMREIELNTFHSIQTMYRLRKDTPIAETNDYLPTLPGKLANA